MSNFHQVLFQWPHTEPTIGIVTGTFDNWSGSVPLTRTSTGLEATVDIPWGQKIKYKFILDGRWVLLEDQPTEVDPGGYVNNVYTAPPKPITQERNIEDVFTNGKAELAETKKADPLPQAASVTGPGFPQLLSDVASTVVARDGTSSALGYVASGLGGAASSVVGLDPVNAGQIAIPSPKSDPGFDASTSASTVGRDLAASPILPSENSASSIPSPIAPLVPVTIMPVNVSENNTIGLSSSSTLPVVENSASSLADVVVPLSQNALGETSTHAPVPTLAPELHVPKTNAFSEASAPAAEVEKLLVVAEKTSIPVAEKEVPETQKEVLISQDDILGVTEAPSAQEEASAVGKEASSEDVAPSGLPEMGLATVLSETQTNSVDQSEIPAAISASPSPTVAAFDHSTIEKTTSSPPLDSERPVSNGRVTPTLAKEASTFIPNAPSTPVKGSSNPFPTSSPSSSANGSPSSSKFGTPNSARKKRTSIFGKLKHIFHHDKDKEKGKK